MSRGVVHVGVVGSCRTLVQSSKDSDMLEAYHSIYIKYCLDACQVLGIGYWVLGIGTLNEVHSDR